MTLAFSFPTVASPLRRFDPRWKLVSFVLAGLAVASLRTLIPSLIAFCLSLLLVFVARLPWNWYARRLSGVALFLGLFVVFLPFTVDGGVQWTLGPLEISQRGLILAGVVLAKGLTLATLLVLLVASGSVEDLMKAAQSLRVPGLIVQVSLLAYRYLHLLLEELNRLRIALRVRGFRGRTSLHCYRTVGQVTGTLLVRGHERAERVGQAMRCRGFDGHFRTLTAFHTRVADVAWAVTLLVGSAGLLLSDLLLR